MEKNLFVLLLMGSRLRMTGGAKNSQETLQRSATIWLPLHTARHFGVFEGWSPESTLRVAHAVTSFRMVPNDNDP